ncbi:MAG: hypothetical protein ACKO96_30380, partial [Flammeovirgaceae bacterium]
QSLPHGTHALSRRGRHVGPGCIVFVQDERVVLVSPKPQNPKFDIINSKIKMGIKEYNDTVNKIKLEDPVLAKCVLFMSIFGFPGWSTMFAGYFA